MENLKPAITAHTPMNLNDGEFQSMLSAWLEDKGIISDIRSQIRFKMVNVLRNTTIGRNTCRKLLQNSSLSKQALNMIVAEYLLRNNYEYSLSVFNTEASMLNVIPGYPKESNGTEVHKNIFNNDNMLHLLELIGIHKNCSTGQEILNLYYQEPRYNCILYCLIYTLSNPIKKKKQVNEQQTKHFDITNESHLVKVIVNFLNKFSIPFEEIKCLTDAVKKIYFSEIHDVEVKHFQELLKYEKKLESKEKMINDICRTKRKLEDKLSKLQREEERFSESKLVNEDSNVKDKRLIENLKKPKCAYRHCGKICSLNFDTIEEMKMENVHLKKDNFDLKAVNNEKQKDLLLLSKKYNDLTNAFMDCQNKLLLLTTRLSESSNQASFEQLRGGTTKSKDSTYLSDDKLKKEAAAELAKKYHVFFEKSESEVQQMIEAELELWKQKWVREKYDCTMSAIQLIKHCDKNFYPTLHVLFRIFITLPISNASSERSFSILRIIKTWLRATMAEDRLIGLALLYSHRNI